MSVAWVRRRFRARVRVGLLMVVVGMVKRVVCAGVVVERV